MQQKERLKLVAVTSLIWILCLSACSNIKIKTWFLDGRDSGELIRKDGHGSVTERKTVIEADGYLCYSPEDDKAWRDRLAVCCANFTQERFF